MRIAITGGTGFVGRHLADRLRTGGHEVVVISRRTGHGLGSSAADGLTESFRGCDAIVHCAGINRELGAQTYDAVHVRGTTEVIAAATSAGVPRIVMLSFLRARPDGPTTYHRSKWAAEELIRASSLTYTIPAPFASDPPDDLAPITPFDAETIRRGLPEPGGFGLADLRCAS